MVMFWLCLFGAKTVIGFVNQKLLLYNLEKYGV